jgi:acetyl-CoA carboxylase biotin carboxyl carrier protein
MAKKKQAGTKPRSAASAPPAGAAADLEVLRALVAMLDDSSAATIKLKRGEATYEVSRGGGSAMAASLPAAVPAVAPAPAPAAPAAAAVAPPAPAAHLLDVKSPMVGTFYRAPEPGAEPYVKPGTRVATGQTLCIIEAMKIMNELESEVTGVVREVLVEDAQPVEFGQVLFRVDPNG